jgi:tetratricopeptide (TPR) repeat protein
MKKIPLVAVITLVVVASAGLAAYLYQSQPGGPKLSINESKTDKLARLMSQADDATRFQEYGKAIGLIDESIALAPTDSRLWHQRGSVYIRMKDSDRAIESFSKALALNSTNDQALLDRASCYYETRAYQKAMADYESVIAVKDSHYLKDARLGQALCHYSLGHYALAIHQCRELLRDHPDYLKAIELLANSYVSEGNALDAVDAYTRGLRLDHDNGDLYYGRASAYYKNRMPDQALADLTKAVKCSPTNAEYHLKLATVAKELGKKDLASNEAAVVLKLGGKAISPANKKAADAILAK